MPIRDCTPRCGTRARGGEECAATGAETTGTRAGGCAHHRIGGRFQGRVAPRAGCERRSTVELRAWLSRYFVHAG